MKTMKRLVNRFNRIMAPECTAWLDEIGSYKGYYQIAITDGLGMTAYYTFASCKDFKDWTDNVLLY